MTAGVESRRHGTRLDAPTGQGLLTTADIDDFYGHLLRAGGRDERSLAPGTVSRVHGVLHRALSQALRWEWIWINPATNATPPRVAPAEIRPPSPGQVGVLLDWAERPRGSELAEAAADAEAVAQAHNILGILASRSADPAEARRHLERSLALAKTFPDPTARVAALNNLALVHGSAGELDRAVELAEQALLLCERQGDRHREAALHNNLADLLHAADRAEEAMSHLKKAVTIFSEVGQQTGEIQPEIWKLVEW